MAVACGLMLRRFPAAFCWGEGEAIAAHQVEGGTVNSDGWVLGHLPHAVR